MFRSLSSYILVGLLIYTYFPALHQVSAATPVDEEARRIVEKADRIRFPQQAFQVSVVITTLVPNREPDIRSYRVLAKGTENSIVQTLSPPSERGQILLMRGPDLWIFLPAISQPVRLPLSQRLTGQVANGDLARANFAGNYNPKLLRIETIEKARHYVIELTAAHKRVTYHRILYWVNKSNYRPFKAEFYSRSNRLLKTGYFRDYKMLGDSVRPSKLVFEDALRKGERSVLEYSALKIRNIPDKVFSKSYLKKLR